MDLLRSAIAEYEDVLVGNKKNISTYYFSYNATGNMKMALQIMKYAFDTYLHWSPSQLRDCLTFEVIERLKLTSLMRYIVFPVELDSEKDLFYIAWQLYPGTVHFSEKDLILRIYNNLLDKKLNKYPKKFFDGAYGTLRAQVCLRYMIEQFLPVKSVDELYELFASQKCIKSLRKYKLLFICQELFDSPMEYLHNALPKEQQNQFLYRFYEFDLQRSEQRAQMPEQSSYAEAGDHE
jgi:hypothetical protein